MTSNAPMEKKYYALRLLPPRPTFAMDMSNDERDIMQLHVAYWMKFMAEGKVIVFGPVFDPAGAYGLGVVYVKDEEEVKSLIEGDPANGLNTYVWSPMMAIVPKK